MATQAESTANEQQLLSQGITQEQIDSERALGKSGLMVGQYVDTKDMAGFINKYKPTAGEVYSGSNVAGAIASPAAKPDLSDPLGLYDFYMGSTDIKGAEAKNKEAQDLLMKAQQGARSQQTAIQNLPQALNVIRGEQAVARDLSSNELAALSENAQAAQSYLMALKQTASEKFQIAKGERDTLTSLIANNPGAGITYFDTPQSAAAKIEKYQVGKAKEEQKSNYKQKLKEIAVQYGLKTKGSTKELEKRIGKYNKSALEDAKRMNELDYKSRELDIKAKIKALNAPTPQEIEDSIWEPQNNTQINAGTRGVDTDFMSIYG